MQLRRKTSAQVTVFVIMIFFIQNLHYFERWSNVSQEEMDFIIILCTDPCVQSGQCKKYKALARDIKRQILQAYVLIKSMVLFSKLPINIHIIADNKNPYEELIGRIDEWPTHYRSKVTFSLKDVYYPEDRPDLRKLYRVCATERLFIPDMFPELEKAIYVDTDLIFLRPVEDLWNFFQYFGEDNIAAMTPCLSYYGFSSLNQIPYYGSSGLNAGVMMMDLSKARSIRGGWTNLTLSINDAFLPEIRLADQDILNIVFHYHPEWIYSHLPCHFNFRPLLCNTSQCPSALRNGISILHGNSVAFLKGNEKKIEAVFQTFSDINLNQNNILKDLLAKLIIKLDEVTANNETTHFCSDQHNIDEMILKEIQKYVPGLP